MERREFVFGAAAVAAASVAATVAATGAGAFALTGAGAVESKRYVIGRSVRGRPIVACRRGPADASEIYLVLGQMHGDEVAGVGVTRGHLAHLVVPNHVQLWIIPTMNPDGLARGRRANAHGVDLNRNFADGNWVKRGVGTQFYSGPEPMSEPESRAVKDFLDDLTPRTVVSMHQPLACVDYSGGERAVTDWLARELHLPARTIDAPGGNLSAWYNTKYEKKTVVTLELPPSTTEQYRGRVARVLVRHAASRRR
jgi:protein MpaA